VHTKKCNQWLVDNGIITSDMTTPERMKALAKYRTKITKTPKVPGSALGRRHSQSSDDVEIDLDDIEIEF
jgi:hypothetical protein